MLPEENVRTPDIRYREAGQLKHCEVKTIGLSDAEIGRRQSRGVLRTGYSAQLDSGFLNKFSSVVATAKARISARKTDGLVYLVVLFDDMALDHYPDYRRQLISFCREKEIRDVYIKVGPRWFRRIRITRRCS